jgi:hypothetical protein
MQLGSYTVKNTEWVWFKSSLNLLLSKIKVSLQNFRQNSKVSWVFKVRIAYEQGTYIYSVIVIIASINENTSLYKLSE